jgi:S-formylglutathione hydrolase FrmB
VIRRLALLTVLLAAGCGGGGDMERLPVDSALLGRTLEQGVYDPGEAGRPLLVLLHGRGSDPEDVWTLGLRDRLERLGSRAPAVLLVDGGDHSYYHDRRDGRWGDYVVRDAIPAALAQLRADPKRIAIGGISMGGFGALDLARLHPQRFCAVGGHSPAVWRTGGETPAGAFDDAEDFSRHDLFGGPFDGRAAVWIDVGRDDPFHDAAGAYAQLLRRHGRDVTLRISEGGHDREYWKRHLDEYLSFYADALARCQ